MPNYPSWLSSANHKIPITFAWELEGDGTFQNILYFYYPDPITPTPSGAQEFTPDTPDSTEVTLNEKAWFSIPNTTVETVAKLLTPKNETYNKQKLFTQLATYKETLKKQGKTFLLRKWDNSIGDIYEKKEKFERLIWNDEVLNSLHYELLIEPHSNKWEIVTKALDWDTYSQTVKTGYEGRKQNLSLGAFHSHLVFHAPPINLKDKFENWAERIAYFYEYIVISIGLAIYSKDASTLEPLTDQELADEALKSSNIKERLYVGEVISKLADKIKKRTILETPAHSYSNRSNYKFICVGFRQTYKDDPEDPSKQKNNELYGFEFRALQKKYYTTSDAYLKPIQTTAKVLQENQHFLEDIWAPSPSAYEGLLKAIFIDDFDDLKVKPITVNAKNNQVASPTITINSFQTIGEWNSELKKQLNTTYNQGNTDIITFPILWNRIKNAILDNRNLPKEKIRSQKHKNIEDTLKAIIEKNIKNQLKEELHHHQQHIKGNNKNKSIQEMIRSLLYQRTIVVAKTKTISFKTLRDNLLSCFYHYIVNLVPLFAKDWLRLIILWRNKQWTNSTPESPLQKEIDDEYNTQITIIENLISTLSAYKEYETADVTNSYLGSLTEAKNRNKCLYTLPFKTWEDHPAIPPELISNIQQARKTYAQAFTNDVETYLKTKWKEIHGDSGTDNDKGVKMIREFALKFQVPFTKWAKASQLVNHLRISSTIFQPTLYYEHPDKKGNPVPFTPQSLKYL